MRKPKRIRRSHRKNTFLQFLVLTIICGGLAFPVSYAWQKIEDKHYQGVEQPFSPSAQKISENPIENESSQNTSKDTTSAESTSSNITENENTESTTSDNAVNESIAPTKNADIVPENTRVRSEYFDDAVFIGDSITTGIKLYDVLPNSNVLASVGVNLQSIINAEIIPTDNGKTTVLKALESLDVNKIYIMLGSNGLAFLGTDSTVEYYEKFLDEVIAIKPNATIYIQSIFPIDEVKFAKNYKGELKNTTITETNEKLIALAKEKNVYYVDPASIFKDENGGLAEKVTSDGLHFNAEYYTKWIDYLKKHTINK